MGLHAEQHFEYHMTLKAGDILTASPNFLIISLYFHALSLNSRKFTMKARI